MDKGQQADIIIICWNIQDITIWLDKQSAFHWDAKKFYIAKYDDNANNDFSTGKVLYKEEQISDPIKTVHIKYHRHTHTHTHTHNRVSLSYDWSNTAHF